MSYHVVPAENRRLGCLPTSFSEHKCSNSCFGAILFQDGRQLDFIECSAWPGGTESFQFPGVSYALDFGWRIHLHMQVKGSDFRMGGL